MTLTYNWHIDKIYYNETQGSLSNIITRVEWRKTGTDSAGNVGTFEGCTSFGSRWLDSSSVTPYENLTEETIWGWIRNDERMSSVYADHIDERIKLDLKRKLQSIQETGPGSFPWD